MIMRTIMLVFLTLLLTACDRIEAAHNRVINPAIESPLQNICQPRDGFAEHFPVCE